MVYNCFTLTYKQSRPGLIRGGFVMNMKLAGLY
jgi:hypothetical protein